MEKKKYITPQVEFILIDNEISLALESVPPVGPSESLNLNKKNPFKTDINFV